MDHPRVIVWESRRKWTDRLRSVAGRAWVVHQVTNESDCELALQRGARVVLLVEVGSWRCSAARWLWRRIDCLGRPPVIALVSSTDIDRRDLTAIASALGVRWVAEPDVAAAALIEVLARLLIPLPPQRLPMPSAKASLRARPSP